MSEDKIIGSDTNKNLGVRAEACRLTYRTTGITDNSGTWQTIDNSGDLSGVGGAPYIQFSPEFRMADHLIPSRLLGLCVTFSDNESSNWSSSSNIGTDLVAKKFGFKMDSAYGGTVPRLVMEVFDADTGASLGTSDSTLNTANWEKSINGGSSWTAYNTTDKMNNTTYIRVALTSLADNIVVRPTIREY